MLRKKKIGFVKGQWRHRRGSDVTWESKGEFRNKYPQLFQNNFGEEMSLGLLNL